MMFAQIVITALLLIGLLDLLHQDVCGRPTKDPQGFPGVVITLIIFAIVVWMHYAAGLFSTFIPK